MAVFRKLRSRLTLSESGGALQDQVDEAARTGFDLTAAASTQPARPRRGYIALGVLLVTAGALAGWGLYIRLNPADFVPKSDYSVFAGLFILAAAIERLLEPFTPLVPPKTEETKTELEAAVVAASENQSAGANQQQAAANKQAQLDRERAERGILLWAIASMTAIVACSLVGLFMLRAVADVPRCDPKSTVTAEKSEQSEGLRTPRGCTENDPNRFIDLVATGLVVGAGTKPLHDLITRVQVKKEKEQDPPETNS